MRLSCRVWLMVLLLAAVVALGVGASGGDQSAAAVAQWGEACLPWHPPACYTGSNGLDATAGQLPVASFASSAGILASDPTAVELMCFAAQGADGVINIEWQTGTEFDTWGFYLLRSETENGSFAPISEFIIHCDDSGLVGGYYFFQDFAVVNGETYYYRLQEMINANESVYYPSLSEPPISAVAGLPLATATFTPSATPTRTPTPSSTPTRTPTATQPGSTLPTVTPDLGTQSSTLASPTTTPIIPLGSTFTPTPVLNNSPLPTGTQRSATTEMEGEGTDEPASPTPINVVAEVLQSNLPTPGYPLPGEGGQLTLEAYPVPPGMPSVTPFAGDYELPSVERQPQLATMTPAPGSYPLWQGESSESSTRTVLCLGFVFSFLVLIAALIVMSRLGQRSASVLSSDHDAAEPGPWPYLFSSQVDDQKDEADHPVVDP